MGGSRGERHATDLAGQHDRATALLHANARAVGDDRHVAPAVGEVRVARRRDRLDGLGAGVVRRIPVCAVIGAGIPCRLAGAQGLPARLYRRTMRPLLEKPRLALLVLGIVLALLAGSLLWPGLLRAALARCFARPDPEEIDFLVRMGYPQQ